jgi:plasmid maintenance system killer protein
MLIKAKKNIQDPIKNNKNLVSKYEIWLNLIDTYGIECHQKHKGFKFEKLSGTRKEEYSIRLNKSWRVIFKIENDTIYILEITNHEY